MRYPQGGGLTSERQVFRERIRMEAAERFAAGASNGDVAKDLRVSVHSVQRWRRAWQDAGPEGLRSTGPVSTPKLSEALFAVLEVELAKGAVAHGWPDQTWTLARVKKVIGRRFHKVVHVVGRLSDAAPPWLESPGSGPSRGRAGRRRRCLMGEGDLAVGGSTAAALDAYLVFEDEAGFSMTPPTVRTWSRRGQTPIFHVRGRSQRRISIAALTCYKAGESSRLICRPIVHPDHKAGGRRSFAWTDYRDLLIVAHKQLGIPIVLVWASSTSTATAACASSSRLRPCPMWW
jgi:transposase